MSFNVLIIDDSFSMRRIIRRILSISGFDLGLVLEAANGREALELMSENWVDLILSDINMPEMDGLTFLKEVRKSEVHKNTPVVIITTEACTASLNEAYALGVRDYIKKPFVPEQIRDRLTGILKGGKA